MKPTLLVLAAGMGSRYGGLKQMDGVGPHGEIIMDYSIEDAIRAGFGKVVFVIRHSFEEEFKRHINADHFAAYTREEGLEDILRQLFRECEELNGGDFTAIPFEPDSEHPGSKMKIGYITKKNIHLSRVGKMYIEELKKYLGVQEDIKQNCGSNLDKR